MKFGAQLAAYAVPEWADHYIHYKSLKDYLKTKAKKISRFHPPPTSSSMGGASSSDDGHRHHQELGLEASNISMAINLEFTELLEAELVRVERHFDIINQHLVQRLIAIEEELLRLDTEEVKSKEQVREMEAHKKRLQRACAHVWDTFDKLEDFVKLNTMAVYKVLKKRDKMIGTCDRGLLLDLSVYTERFKRLTIDPAFRDSTERFFRRIIGREDEDDVVDVRTALSAISLIAKQPFRPNAAQLAFFTGACTVLLIDVLVLCFVPATNGKYHMEQMLAVLPFFRFNLMFVLLIWALGVAFYFFEEFGVNYRFLFGVDAKANVNSETIFAFAAIQSTIWIVIFGIFLADYKFFTHRRQTLHYVYPWALILVQVVLCLLPHPTFRYRYRRALLRLVGAALISGVWPPKDITLAVNVVSDIVTSFSKPLADFGYMICYMTSGFRHSEPAVCPNLDFWLRPLLVGYPFWSRFVQCFVRYRKEPAPELGGTPYVHFANMGKYMASLSVVFVTSVSWGNDTLSGLYMTRFVWVAAYMVATVYAFVWDIYMDWGLFPDPDALVRPYDQTMFPQWVYYTIALIDLVGRLTWAMTLMPVTFINSRHMTSALLTFGISSVEIVRRSAWLMLRLENEHLTNSSKYRAMLWVPRMMDQQILEQQEEIAGSTSPRRRLSASSKAATTTGTDFTTASTSAS